MTDSPLSRRLFIAKAAPLVVATTMQAAASLVAAAEPVEHMRAIIHHFAGLAPDGADRIMLQVGGTPESFGYVVHVFFLELGS